jgi:hypothetical protein
MYNYYITTGQNKELKMQYKVQNVTMNIDRTDGDFTGDCLFYIPFNHVKFMIENCGMSVETRYGVCFVHDYGQLTMDLGYRHYRGDSPDLLIMYLAWLLGQEGQQYVNVEYSNYFWAIHDFEHALNDESGCTVYVDADIEQQRLEDTFVLLKKEGHELTWELLEEVTEAYNGRFGRSVSFEHHFEYDDFDEEEDEEEDEDE